jgi:K+-sensing histidine kinase KdpD
MTIARDIILQHSGEIQAQNNPDGGAMIKIWLPTTKKGMNVL